MNTISFTTANFVAREVGYHMTDGWGQGDKATTEWFKPIETYKERFDAMLAEIEALGFRALDLWVAHLNYAWATPEHIETARQLIAARNMKVVCYGAVGNTPEESRTVCRLCTQLGTSMMRGNGILVKSDRSALVSNLRASGLVFALENHPEKSANEVLATIGDTDADIIGVTIDAGWFATNKVDVPAATRVLAPRLKNFHLKDVKAPRTEPTGLPFIDMGHETCRLGDGIVRIKECVDILREVGYAGPIGIEHEPEEFDPSEDLKASRKLLEQWLAR